MYMIVYFLKVEVKVGAYDFLSRLSFPIEFDLSFSYGMSGCVYTQAAWLISMIDHGVHNHTPSESWLSLRQDKKGYSVYHL